MRLKMLLVLAALSAAIAASADTGPRLTDAEFFAMLDPANPDLAWARQSANSGDYASARHALAQYLRQREKPVFPLDQKASPSSADMADAERALQRDLLSVGVYHKFDGEIDWTLNPINYKEWPFQLNRHAFWSSLSRAYSATADEKYAREFVYQMTDWVAKNPVPLKTSGNETVNWRTIEQGIRCSTSWPEAFYRCLKSPSFTDDAIVTMVKSFVEHARQLTKYRTGGNWLTMEADGLMHVGVLFPEFTESAEWRKTAAERLYAELDRQVYPDGAQVELTTGYHQVSLTNFVKAWRIARVNGVAMPEGYVPKLERMFDYDLKASMPGGTLPGLNDGSRTDIRGRLAEGFELFPKRKDFQWMATSGKQGSRPTVGSLALPFAGQLIMRTGWDPGDLYLLMDAGPFGAGHQHEDALSLVIYAHGRYHLVDPGNYAYDGSPSRAYVLSTRAHNTVMVDGEEQHRRGTAPLVVSKPLPNKWGASASFDYASGSYDFGYGARNQVQVKHTRSIFFVKPDYWIVTDLMVPADEAQHSYQSILHLDAPAANVDPSGSVTTLNPDASNLSIVPIADPALRVSVISGQKEPAMQGWVPAGSASVYEMRPVPTPIFEKQGAGPAWLAYAFYPTAAGEKCAIRSVERLDVRAEQGVHAVGLRIRFAGGRTDCYIQASRRCKLKWNYGPKAFDTDALAAYVRMDGEGVVSAVAVDGATISASGAAVRADLLPVADLSRTTARH